MVQKNKIAEGGFVLEADSKWNFVQLVGPCCNMSCPIWAALPDSTAQHVPMYAT